MEHYPHTMPPFNHQEEELDQHWDKPWRAIFWEQGTGKMKAGYDFALTQWQAGIIDTLIVLAPNGVHRDWVEEGFKKGDPNNPFNQPLVPPEWHDQIDAAWYHGGKAGNKSHQKKMRDLFYSKKFVVLTMSYDSAKTKKNKASGWIGGKLFLEKMLRERRCAFILDEASCIQSPTSQITKTLVGRGGKGGIARHAVSRRIMEGTPVDEGPFNVYPQMQFLDQEFWKDRGFASWASFKTYFGVWREGFNGVTNKSFQQCVGYQNLDELKRILKPHSSRVLKKDALDLPDKLYQHVRFEMSPEQWKMYEQIREELMAMVRADGSDIETLLTAELPIVNVLRLYQITAGYLPFQEDVNGEPVERVHTFKENPRLETALAELRRQTDKTVVWCRFTRDIDLLTAALGKFAVRFDGSISEDERAQNKQEWLKGDAQYLVPQIQAMARGHTLNIAPYVLYYTNDARLRLRRQSEDRTHRGKMNFSVLYGDMLASDTVDEKRVKSLRKKLAVAETIMGDNE
ncbi:helicase [Alphaproteobacteria phage PhiJL001]|uniref:Helicase n=1 Tax=Alphaproteobacteria phage PhiJL001 TaxID=2681607 RepID=Q5DN98_9CAUD|nr:helicase [Alphaproteobacteria phage PhiJL001]AAT69464.1 helicase [Alphaproteobacteria phage PhiJL001]